MYAWLIKVGSVVIGVLLAWWVFGNGKKKHSKAKEEKEQAVPIQKEK